MVASENIFLNSLRLGGNLEKIQPGTGMEIDQNLNIFRYKTGKPKISGQSAGLMKVVDCLKKHVLDDRISKIKRCARCILSITTPGIFIDKDGVCNFCRDSKKIKYGSVAKLKNIINKITNIYIKKKKLELVAHQLQVKLDVPQVLQDLHF